MQSRISQLMGIDYKFDLLLSEDGSGRGAALVAAVLKRTEAESSQNRNIRAKDRAHKQNRGAILQFVYKHHTHVHL